ncbi:MAG: hypothetical protein IRY95_09005, partial [Clostridia bacterium]|nr:hypothetical protein [Clostridia bacterium]
VDRTVAAVAAALPRADLIVAGVAPSGEARTAGLQLTPILAAGPSFAPGLLTSGTTRQPGVVGLPDVTAEAVRRFGGVAPTGHRLQVIPTPDAWTATGRLYDRTAANHLRRPAVLSAWIVGQLVAVPGAFVTLLLAAAGLLRPGAAAAVGAGVPALAFTIGALPAALLGLGAVPGLPAASAGAAAVVAAVAFGPGTLAATRRRWGEKRGLLAALGVVSGLTGALIVADAAAGGFLATASPLGHSLVGGARFYGIGNEYAGVLLGASLVAAGAAADGMAGFAAAGSVVLALAGAAVVSALAAPGLGANVGATVASALAFGYAALRRGGGRPAWRRAAVLAATATAVVFLAAACDLARAPDLRSHLGLTLSRMADEGPGYVLTVAERKLALNWRLIRYTNWSWLFIACLVTNALAFFRPQGVLRRIVAKYPNLGAALAAAAVGACVNLVVNDSGIVAAATTFLPASATLLCLLSHELVEREG